jgi:hypothetical protein
MLPRFVQVAALAACAAGRAAAQPAGRPAAGHRVRLEAPDRAPVTGRVVRVGGDTIWLRAREAGAVAVLRLGQFRTYSVGAGRDRDRGARHGALAGAGAGAAVVALAAYRDARSDAARIVPATAFAAGAAAGLMLLGAGVGALAAPERWGPRLPLRVGLGPACRARRAPASRSASDAAALAGPATPPDVAVRRVHRTPRPRTRGARRPGPRAPAHPAAEPRR